MTLHPVLPLMWGALLTSLILAPRLGLAAPGDFAEPEVEVRWSRSGEAGSSYGWAIADVADVDDDGVRELAVGAPSTIGAEGPAGRLELLSGADGSVLWTIDGTAGDNLGFAMADAGDVDGDGVTDVIVGAPGAEGGGRAEVRSGVDGTLLLALDSPDPTALFGSSVAGGGRLDDDAFADLVVGGAATASPDGQLDDVAGAIWAFAGADGALLWEIHAAPGERLGSGAAHVGDVDDDGYDDPFVGARDGGDGRGWARVVSGVDGATIHELSPDDAGGDFGWFFVAGLDDLDDDGVADLYVGDFASSVAGGGSGRVHVYSGQTAAPLLTIPAVGPGEGLGCGRGAGDVDGDGVPDLLVGAYSSSAGAPQAGRALVFSGTDGQVLRTITSLEAGEQFGFDAVGIGDTDRDGAPELAVAAASGDYVYVLAGLGGDPGDGDGDGDPGDGDGDPGDGDGDPGDGDGDGDPSGTDDGNGETGDAGADADAGSSEGCSCEQGDRAPIATFGLALLALLGLRASRRRAAG